RYQSFGRARDGIRHRGRGIADRSSIQRAGAYECLTVLPAHHQGGHHRRSSLAGSDRPAAKPLNLTRIKEGECCETRRSSHRWAAAGGQLGLLGANGWGCSAAVVELLI